MVNKKSKPVQSAADILAKHNFLQEWERTKQYIHHEFQDFAYRLAVDLGDLQHKSIYMRIAKSQPRHLIEQALVFAKDYPDRNKGKLFMWKLSQLRKDAELVRLNEDFSLQNITKRTANLRNQLTNQLWHKYRIDHELEDLSSVLLKFQQQVAQCCKPRRKAYSALVAEIRQGYVLNSLNTNLPNLKVDAWEISSSLIDKFNSQQPTIKVRKGNPLVSKTFDKSEFAGVWLGNLWKLIPVAEELTVLKAIRKQVLPQSPLVLFIHSGSVAVESWKQLALENIEDPYQYHKVTNLAELIDKLQQSGWEMREQTGDGEDKILLAVAI